MSAVLSPCSDLLELNKIILQELLQYLKILLDVDHITEGVHVGMVVRIVSRHAGHGVEIFSQTQLREGEGGEVFTVVSRVSLLLLRNQIYAMKE